MRQEASNLLMHFSVVSSDDWRDARSGQSTSTPNTENIPPAFSPEHSASTCSPFTTTISSNWSPCSRRQGRPHDGQSVPHLPGMARRAPEASPATQTIAREYLERKDVIMARVLTDKTKA